MRVKRTRLLVLPLSLVLVAGATACSGSKNPAANSSRSTSGEDVAKLPTDQIFEKAITYLKTTDSFRIKGSATSDGEPVSMDYAFVKKDSAGTITTKDTGKIDLLSVNEVVYFKLTDAFWKKQAGADATAVLKMFGGKWLKAAPKDKDFQDITSLTGREKFLDQFVTENSVGKPDLGTPKTINGVDCLALMDTNGQGTVYVAKDDGRLIEIVTTEASAAGTLDFTYGGIAAPVAPAASEVFDMAALTAK